MMRITETVKQLIIINVILFAAGWIMGESVLRQYLALYYPAHPNFQVWQFITHMFMHGGLMHILFNMLGLYMFGSALENRWGGKKFLFFYISCGLGAALLHIAINYLQFNTAMNILTENGFNQQEVISLMIDDKYNPQWLEYISEDRFYSLASALTPVLGASGAIYGIIVAFAFMYPNAELMMIFLPIPIKAKYFVPGILALDLFLGLKGNSVFGSRWDDGIAHFAHLGGALVGFIMMWYWKKNQFNQNRWN